MTVSKAMTVETRAVAVPATAAVRPTPVTGNPKITTEQRSAQTGAASASTVPPGPNLISLVDMLAGIQDVQVQHEASCRQATENKHHQKQSYSKQLRAAHIQLLKKQVYPAPLLKDSSDAQVEACAALMARSDPEDVVVVFDYMWDLVRRSWIPEFLIERQHRETDRNNAAERLVAILRAMLLKNDAKLVLSQQFAIEALKSGSLRERQIKLRHFPPTDRYPLPQECRSLPGLCHAFAGELNKLLAGPSIERHAEASSPSKRRQTD